MNSIISCEDMLRRKIAINLHEWMKGLTFVSKPQAIAVAYKQVESVRPGCRRVFSRTRRAGKKEKKEKKVKKVKKSATKKKSLQRKKK